MEGRGRIERSAAFVEDSGPCSGEGRTEDPVAHASPWRVGGDISINTEAAGGADERRDACGRRDGQNRLVRREPTGSGHQDGGAHSQDMLMAIRPWSIDCFHGSLFFASAGPAMTPQWDHSGQSVCLVHAASAQSWNYEIRVGYGRGPMA